MAKPEHIRQLVAITACLIITGATAAPRSNAARHAFARANPCPATQQPRLPCPGWIIDHITPICLGGPDTPQNMQWQTRREALIKDRTERSACRKPR